MSTVHCNGKDWRLDALETRGARAAATLSDTDLGRGDVCAVILRNDPAIIEALTCIRCLGAIRAILPWYLKPLEFQRILAAIKPRLVIVHADLYPNVVAALDALDADITVAIVTSTADTTDPQQTSIESNQSNRLRWTDLVEACTEPLPHQNSWSGALTFSSGTTGQPKVNRWDDPPPLGELFFKRIKQCPAVKTTIVTAPLCNGTQTVLFNQAWYARADQVILPEFEPEAFLAAVEKYQVNHAYMLPAMFVRLLRLPPQIRARYDISSLNYVLHAGAPCAPEIKRRMIEWWGPVIWEGYGCSEVAIIAMSDSHEWLERPGTVGQPLRPIVILNESNEPCKPGEIGQIAVDTAGLPPSHYRDRRTPLWTKDGIQHMVIGDAGWLDEAGYLYVRGRACDIIDTGRISVNPVDIEDVLFEHEAVLDCAVVPITNADGGQSLGALVEVTDPAINVNTVLREFLTNRISTNEIPISISIHPSSIRAPSGKINRTALAQATKL